MQAEQQRDALKRVSALMDIALELNEPQRTQWLAELRAKEPQIAAQIERLLAAHDLANEKAFLDQTITPASLSIASEEEHQRATAPADMGPYRLIRQIGEGGMSTVWLAERRYTNFVRQVAIKRLPAFRKNDEYERRLLREASILASLDHRNIAKFYDAGVADNGDPYIAMELIDGEPITAYCDRLRLDVKSRIALMTRVCDAVAFLHQHSIIHRDIKPSNVMVDKAGEVKLLDFGIAKLVDDALVLDEATRSSCNAFTPEYAAPEQINGKTVTTATDVYSLGVLLYRLLTGTRPYGRNEPALLIAAAIVNTLPSKPSTLFGAKASMPQTELTQIAEARRSSVRQLYASFRNDLDNVLLKALEKDVAQRYTTVEAFRDDLSAHLESRPIRARPASSLYVMRKFAARHRGGVIASTLAVVGLVAAVGFGAWQARQTQLEVVKTKRVLTFLQTLIAEANPNNTGTETITVLDLLKRAPGVARKQFPNEVELQYEVLKPVERILRDLEAADALEPVEREMVAMLPALSQLPVEESAELRTEYALTLAYLGKQELAEASVEQALTSLKDTGKESSVAYAQALMYKSKMLAYRRKLADAAEIGLDSHKRLASKVNAESPLLTKSAFELMDTLLGAYRWQDAASIGEKHFTLDRINAVPSAKERFQFRMMHAVLRFQLGEPVLADKQYDALLPEAKRFFGVKNVVYPSLLQSAARAATDSGRYEKAMQLYKELEALERENKTPNTRKLIDILSYKAIVYLHEKKLIEARNTIKQADLLLKQSGSNSTLFWQASFQVSLAEQNLDQAALALNNQDAALPPSLPQDALQRRFIALDRATLQFLNGDARQAFDVLAIAIADLRRQMPDNHYRVSRAELRLAQTTAQIGEIQQALEVAISADRRIANVLGETHPLSLQSQFILGKLEEQAGKPDGSIRANGAAQKYQATFRHAIDHQVARFH